MTFATLALVGAAALLGPLLAAPRRSPVPVLVGEIVAGVILGRTGAGVLHPHDATFTLLADIGFVLVMFVAGSHVPVRDPRVRQSLGVGARRAGVVAVVAILCGTALAFAFGTHHYALYAVLLASSSAALALPLLESVGVAAESALPTLAQIALADTACIVALPLAADPSHAARAGLGALVVAACSVVLWLLLRSGERYGIRQRAHEFSKERNLALELRVSLLAVFALAALATTSHVSVMLAGFGFGLAIAATGEPRRLARQVFGLTEGFFGPLFFLWIGASLDLRALGSHPSMIGLGVALGLVAIVAHAVTGLLGESRPLAVVTAVQLGVPIAAVTLGTQRHLLRAGEPAALLLGALVTIAAASAAASLAGRKAAPAAPVDGRSLSEVKTVSDQGGAR